MYFGTNYESHIAENYNFGCDFQILTLKEKRRILKYAKSFLKLQRDEGVMIFGDTHLQNKKSKSKD
jgi:hypothetical protein